MNIDTIIGITFLIGLSSYVAGLIYLNSKVQLGDGEYLRSGRTITPKHEIVIKNFVSFIALAFLGILVFLLVVFYVYEYSAGSTE